LLEVLRDIQEKPAASGFALAGGTSLALRFGHRVSVDLDFFTSGDFDPEKLAASLAVGHEAITGLASGSAIIHARFQLSALHPFLFFILKNIRLTK
jgi:hypothetical protein